MSGLILIALSAKHSSERVSYACVLLQESDSDLSFVEGVTPKKPRTVKKRRRKKGKSIYETYEPAELERSHLTDVDQTIRMTDVPERFQLRPGGAVIPLEDNEDVELADEAAWVYQKLFKVIKTHCEPLRRH